MNGGGNITTVYDLGEFNSSIWNHTELLLPLRGFRRYIAYTYISCNVLGLLLNTWVLFIVGPVLFLKQARVPKSILFYILTLCFSDLMTMFAMVFLNVEIVYGTWRFSPLACTSYLLFDSMNKFVAPIIVFLISRTCHATICLDQRNKERAASLKVAAFHVLISLVIILVILSPILRYSQVYYIVRLNETLHEATYVRKCSFIPPADVELPFNIVVSISSYAIPVCGFLFWYTKVPYFLWKRNENLATIASINSVHPTGRRSITHIIRRVVVVVVVLVVVYLFCWTPYWMGLYAHYFFHIPMTKNKVVAMYFVHLLPYVSCAVYPAIFTLFNRPIQSAHSEWRQAQRRRLRSYTIDTSKRIREVVSTSNSGQLHHPAAHQTLSHQQKAKSGAIVAVKRRATSFEAWSLNEPCGGGPPSPLPRHTSTPVVPDPAPATNTLNDGLRNAPNKRNFFRHHQSFLSLRLPLVNGGAVAAACSDVYDDDDRTTAESMVPEADESPTTMDEFL